MQDAATRMQNLITALLDYSRVGTRRGPFQPVPLDELVGQVVSDLEVVLEESDGRVEVAPLPLVKVDPDQIRQLFQNLIDNSLKYRRPEEPPVVPIAGRLNAQNVTITVSDNGIGFEPDDSERIFEMFSRLHTRQEYVGTGVGLAVCRRIAQRHGGSIAATARPGGKAVFSVTLPLEPGRQD